MFGGGRGMGGGSGGSMMKLVGRSVTRAGVTNIQETLSSSASNATSTSPSGVSRSTVHKLNNNLSLSSASGSQINSSPVPSAAGNIQLNSWPSFSSGSSGCDDFEWVSIDATGNEEERERLIVDDFVLGPVPSLDEVNSAVSALNHVFDTSSYPYSQFVTDKFGYNVDRDAAGSGMLHRVSPVGSETDWMEPSPVLHNSGMLNPYIPDRVYDAFHLLQHEPSVKRMVISLSSDKAVWDAILNNDVVRELREAYNAEKSNISSTLESSDEEVDDDSNPAMNAVKWIFENTKAKFLEVLDKITVLMNVLFKTSDVDDKTTETIDPFEERLRTCFLLSVVVFMIVVVTRARGA